MNKKITDYVIKRQQTIGEKTFDTNILKRVKSIDLTLFKGNKSRSIENANNYKRSKIV